MLNAVRDHCLSVFDVPVLKQPSNCFGIFGGRMLYLEIPTNQFHTGTRSLFDFEPILPAKIDVGFTAHKPPLGLPGALASTIEAALE